MTGVNADRSALDAVAAVRDAAVEHALCAGESRRALALAGALDRTVGRGDGTAASDPALTALSTAVAALVGVSRTGVGATQPAGPTATEDPLTTVAGKSEADAVAPAARGAALACDRHGLRVDRAAALAGVTHDAVERARAARRANDPDERS